MGDSITRQSIKDEAVRRGWTFEEIDEGALYYKVTDDKGRFNIGRGARFLNSSKNGATIARLKELSYAFIESIGYTVPAYAVVTTLGAAEAFLATHGTIVVKPSDGEQSRGVTVGVSSSKQLHAAFDAALRETTNGAVVLQAHQEGRLYRLLVVDGKLFASAYRRAAFVTGDGHSTVRQLIERKNQDPLRSDNQPTPLKTIKVKSVEAYLGSERLESILAEGEELELLPIASISLGGEAADVTDSVHEFYRDASEKIAQSLQLGVCGIDIITPDITQPPAEPNFYPIIEVNSLPGFKLHLYPTAGGVPRNPAAAILDAAFPVTD